MGDKQGDNSEQSTPALGKQYEQAALPGPVPSRARVTAAVLSIVLGLWMLVCSGLVFVDAFESFTDNRIVGAVVLTIALAAVTMGIVCLRLTRDRRQRLPLSIVGVLAAAVIASLLLFNTYGLLLLVPTLILALPAILLLFEGARQD